MEQQSVKRRKGLDSLAKQVAGLISEENDVKKMQRLGKMMTLVFDMREMEEETRAKSPVPDQKETKTSDDTVVSVDDKAPEIPQDQNTGRGRKSIFTPQEITLIDDIYTNSEEVTEEMILELVKEFNENRTVPLSFEQLLKRFKYLDSPESKNSLQKRLAKRKKRKRSSRIILSESDSDDEQV